MKWKNNQIATSEPAEKDKRHIKPIILFASIVPCVALFLLLTNGLTATTTQSAKEQTAQNTTVQKEPEISTTQDFAVVESEGGIYSGPIEKMVYSGNGEFQHLDGGIYTGSFADSKRNGNGVFKWENGDSFSGTWSNDQMQKGTYQFSDGRRYEGTFSNNTFAAGTFSLDQSSAAANGYLTFQASLENGTVAKLNFKSNSGTVYQGDVSGKADITYPTGNTYSGDVANGVRQGTGSFYWRSNGELVPHYTGSWENNVMNGSGTYYFGNTEYPYIQGTFVNGKPDGQATYYKEADNTFITTWSNGKCIQVVEN